jgi:hypothetical protein
MAFFANSTNFQITGGSFNVIHGDMTQEDHTYATYTSNSHNTYPDNNYPDYDYPDYPDNNYPNDIQNRQYYDYYAPRPPRGRYPPHPRSQRRHQERGAYGYTEYYDDSQSEGYYGGGYGPQDVPDRFESSLRSSARHTEISGGDFIATRGRNSRRYRPDVAPSPTHESQDSTPISSEADSLSFVTDAQEQENTDLDASSDIPMADEGGAALQESATAVPTAIPDTPLSETPAKKTPTNLEKMRRAMAHMEIDEPEAVNTAPAPTRIPSEGKQKSQSFVPKMFRPKYKP